jgi:hypothetical protein
VSLTSATTASNFSSPAPASSNLSSGGSAGPIGELIGGIAGASLVVCSFGLEDMRKTRKEVVNMKIH